MAAITAPKPSPLAVFKRRNFTLLWSADFVSTMGSALTSLAAGILVFQLTGSAMSVGLILIATAVPSLLVGLVAGVFVDRYDRKKIMVASDLLRAVLVLLIPILYPYGIGWLYVLVILASAIDKFFRPAHESVLPETAPDEELAAANSFMAISSFGSTAIGFAASGLIASAASINWAFWLDSLTFLLSAVFVLLMSVPKVEAQTQTSVKNVVQNLQEGGKFLFGTPILRSSFVVGILIFISFGLANALLLPFAIRALGADEFVYGIQEGLTSLGFVIGSFTMAGLADRLRDGQWYSIGILGMGVAGIIYSQATSIPFAIGMVMISGYMNALMFVGRRLIFQRNTTREVRGRVASAYIVAGDVLFMVGMGMAGLADIIDVRTMMLASGIVTLAAGGISLFLPGLGQPAAEWRRAVSLLRGAAAAPGLGAGRLATPQDLDALAKRLPAFAGLNQADRQKIAESSLVTEAPEGTAIVRRDETSNEAYFIIEGRAVAGRQEGDDYRPLEVLNAGDFFGEIAAITGVPRTANVVVEEPATLLRVPAETLQLMMGNEELKRLFLSKMTERMVRMSMVDLPRFAGVDEQTLKDLRSSTPNVASDASQELAPAMT